MKTPIRTIRVAVGPKIAVTSPEPPIPSMAQTTAAPGIPPLIDIHEAPDGLILEADLPGASSEGLTVQLEDNVLSLRANAVSPAPEGVRAIHEEFRAGEFQRSFILSDDVDRERISAELKNGVLKLTLPRVDRAKTRRIEIKSS
jgi:HSP20 family protein